MWLILVPPSTGDGKTISAHHLYSNQELFLEEATKEVVSQYTKEVAKDSDSGGKGNQVWVAPPRPWLCYTLSLYSDEADSDPLSSAWASGWGEPVKKLTESESKAVSCVAKLNRSITITFNGLPGRGVDKDQELGDVPRKRTVVLDKNSTIQTMRVRLSHPCATVPWQVKHSFVCTSGGSIKAAGDSFGRVQMPLGVYLWPRNENFH